MRRGERGCLESLVLATQRSVSPCGRLAGCRGANTGKEQRRLPVFNPLYFVRGFPGHPLHPPMTDGAIGAYTAAVVLGCLGTAGIAENELAKGWWLALLVGLGFGGLAA